MRVPRWWLSGALVLLAPAAAGAQDRGGLWSWSRSVTDAPRVQETAIGPVRAGAASLVLPGAGQHILGQTRKWAYLAVEVAALVVHVERRARGSDLRNDYRDLAWSEARVQGAARVDGDFRYYETLTHWVRSGAYDMDAVAAGVQPESDPSAFNGFIWDRARAIFFPAGQQVTPGDSAYQAALAYYVDHAYGEELLWDWSGSPGAQATFIDLIGRSDDRFRQATAALGAIFLNHLVSAVDAYLSAGRRSAHLVVAPDPVTGGVSLRGWVAPR